MSDTAMNLPQLPDAWTPIASRPRGVDAKLVWKEYRGAVLTVDLAQALAKKKHIFMANRHTDEEVELVVRAKADPKPDLTAEPPARLRSLGR